MKSAEELYQTIVRSGKAIRGSMGESRYVYGEIYADAVFGVLLSAVSDSEVRKRIADIAFEKYRSSDAMCVSLERESIAFAAMDTALEKGMGEAIRIHLGAAPDDELINKFIEEIRD